MNGGEFFDILFFIDRAEISEAELKALTMVPDLIAELKRCYEEIDNLVKEKNRLIDIAERGGAWEGGIDEEGAILGKVELLWTKCGADVII